MLGRKIRNYLADQPADEMAFCSYGYFCDAEAGCHGDGALYRCVWYANRADQYLIPGSNLCFIVTGRSGSGGTVSIRGDSSSSSANCINRLNAG